MKALYVRINCNSTYPRRQYYVPLFLGKLWSFPVFQRIIQARVSIPRTGFPRKRVRVFLHSKAWRLYALTQRSEYFMRYLEVSEIFREFWKILGQLEKIIVFLAVSQLFLAIFSTEYSVLSVTVETIQFSGFPHDTLHPCCFESCFISIIPF